MLEALIKIKTSEIEIKSATVGVVAAIYLVTLCMRIAIMVRG